MRKQRGNSEKASRKTLGRSVVGFHGRRRELRERPNKRFSLAKGEAFGMDFGGCDYATW
ncbi:hypothetical protein L484_011512 [Morus notabilis]|uniref:Uncharacterized protein n=1 Tax=Morus notabilis TaxID=981085 RepID=W9R966_9ROSA|nr:hypothetical protein L484_011512 [Morus notabilis]